MMPWCGEGRRRGGGDFFAKVRGEGTEGVELMDIQKSYLSFAPSLFSDSWPGDPPTVDFEIVADFFHEPHQP